MSLSSLLLGSQPPIDTELDGLFKAQTPKAPVPIPIPGLSKETVHPKRKIQALESVIEHSPKKRSKVTLDSQTPDKTSKSPRVEQSTTKKSKKAAPVAHEKKNGKEKVQIEQDEDMDDNSDLENAYHSRQFVAKPKAVEDKDLNTSDGDSGDEDEKAPTNIIHESLSKGTKKKPKTTKKKFVPEDETPERRDQRTVFVGNLPLDIASKNPLKKQLQRHIISFIPTAKIESVRFRSIPFQVPTAKLPTSDDEGDKSKSLSKPSTTKKDIRAHEKERASLWRTQKDDKDEENVRQDEKKFLTPAQKKKISFINQEFHSTADTVNAYVVFAFPLDSKDRPSNLPPLPQTLDPYSAAVQAAAKADGSVFMDRMIRVDLVGKHRPPTANVSPERVDEDSQMEADPRLSVFVGNLDFASKEEDLRIFFEGLVSAERGPPREDPAAMDIDADPSATKPLTWVTRVRIVRDKDTLLGKGFAYVQFADRECVDEVLALEETKLKFAKRKLRVQRCKTLPGGPKQKISSAKAKPDQKFRPAHVALEVPKGDPLLGEKLAGLPKEERKKLKSTDADRVARRLAKKKARMAMPPSVGKSASKERKRVRSK